jgi:hypothetical protein
MGRTGTRRTVLRACGWSLLQVVSWFASRGVLQCKMRRSSKLSRSKPATPRGRRSYRGAGVPGLPNSRELLLVFEVDGESKARPSGLSIHDGWLIASRIRPRHFHRPRIHP